MDHSEKLKDVAGDRSDLLSVGGGDCGGGANGRAPAPARDPAPVGDADAAWRLEPHICRACMSRLVSRDAGDGMTRYHCSNCGLGAVGASADVLCCCGMKIRRPLKGGKSGVQLVSAGIRCAPNPDPRPDFPSLYVALEVGA